MEFDDNAELWEAEYERINKNRNAYFKIEKMSLREAFRIMEDFVDEIQGARTRNRLIDALNRKSPFSEF